MTDWLGTIRQALAAPLLDRPRVGPFAVLIDETSASPFRNYAVQLAPATARDVSELSGFFAGHDRRPRLEIVSNAPDPELLAAGYVVERALPVCLLAETGIVEPPAAFGFVVGAAEDLLALAAMTGAAYGDPEPAERGAERFAGSVRGGGYAVAAREIDTGRTVSGGLATPPVAGLTEVCAVATDTEFRRRGLAALVVAELCRHQLDRGHRPFLQAESEREAAIYARVGFERCGSLLLINGPQTR